MKQHADGSMEVMPSRRAPHSRSLLNGIWGSSVIRYLVAGGLSFAFDVGLLWVLHDIVRISLPVATPAAFLASFVVTFTLQRMLAFRAQNAMTVSVVRYAVLVVVNTILTTLIVWGLTELGSAWIVGKTVAVVLTTIGNYFAYRYWVFTRPKETSIHV